MGKRKRKERRGGRERERERDGRTADGIGWTGEERTRWDEGGTRRKSGACTCGACVT